MDTDSSDQRTKRPSVMNHLAVFEAECLRRSGPYCAEQTIAILKKYRQRVLRTLNETAIPFRDYYIRLYKFLGHQGHKVYSDQNSFILCCYRQVMKGILSIHKTNRYRETRTIRLTIRLKAIGYSVKLAAVLFFDKVRECIEISALNVCGKIRPIEQHAVAF